MKTTVALSPSRLCHCYLYRPPVRGQKTMANFQRKRHAQPRIYKSRLRWLNQLLGMEAPAGASLTYVVPKAYGLSLQCRDQRPTGLCREYLLRCKHWRSLLCWVCCLFERARLSRVSGLTRRSQLQVAPGRRFGEGAREGRFSALLVASAKM